MTLPDYEQGRFSRGHREERWARQQVMDDREEPPPFHGGNPQGDLIRPEERETYVVLSRREWVTKALVTSAITTPAWGIVGLVLGLDGTALAAVIGASLTPQVVLLRRLGDFYFSKD